MAGPTGCGLCGIESLIEAMCQPPDLHSALVFTPDQIMTAISSLFPLQELNRETSAVHGASFSIAPRPRRRARGRRRHNALDKLAGALGASARRQSKASVLTSRVSVEMVQKSADRRADHRRRLGADRACPADGRGGRHDRGRAGPQRRVRGVHPSAPHRRCDGRGRQGCRDAGAVALNRASASVEIFRPVDVEEGIDRPPPDFYGRERHLLRLLRRDEVERLARAATERVLEMRRKRHRP